MSFEAFIAMQRDVHVEREKKRKTLKDFATVPIPVPMNKFVRKNLTTIRTAKAVLVKLRAKCKHHNIPTRHIATDDHDGITVGLFDTTLLCKKCGTESVLKSSPPVCSCCLSPLVLKVWEGKQWKGNGQNSVTKQQLATWKKEHTRRSKLFNSDPLLYGMFFTQFGLYVCENKKCTKTGDPVFMVTPGD